MGSIIPSKLDSFIGQPDALTVNDRLYKVETYLNQVQLENTEIVLNGNARVAFASRSLKKTAAIWCYMLVQSGQVPGQWNMFPCAVVKVFIS